MGLARPGLTTTRTNNKHKRSNSKKLQKATAEHEAWLKTMGVGKLTTPMDAKDKQSSINEIPDYKCNNPVPLGNQVAGMGPTKDANTYSGERTLLGICTMHKSNMVPVFADKKEDAKDIARMRR
jgi:hypothetical protein